MNIIFHLAALISIPYSYKSPKSYLDTNITGTYNILEAARENNVELWIPGVDHLNHNHYKKESVNEKLKSGLNIQYLNMELKNLNIRLKLLTLLLQVLEHTEVLVIADLTTLEP